MFSVTNLWVFSVTYLKSYKAFAFMEPLRSICGINLRADATEQFFLQNIFAPSTRLCGNYLSFKVLLCEIILNCFFKKKNFQFTHFFFIPFSKYEIFSIISPCFVSKNPALYPRRVQCKSAKCVQIKIYKNISTIK